MDLESGHGGLGWQMPLVVDPKLAAPRGDEHTNAWAQKRAHLGDSLFEGEEEEDGAVPAPAMSLSTAIPEENIGYKMLQKMGWTAGKGLGRNEDGITEPVKAGVEAGVVLGLGKQQQDDFFMMAENVTRKRLETEVQAMEDELRRERREAEAEREAKIKEEVQEIKKTFLCELCNKQYNLAVELDVHLSSYDHNHKKRLVDMRATEAARTRGDREKKERKKAEREMAALNAQAARAAAAAKGGSGAAKPSHGISHGATAPPPPPELMDASSADPAGGWASSIPRVEATAGSGTSGGSNSWQQHADVAGGGWSSQPHQPHQQQWSQPLLPPSPAIPPPPPSGAQHLPPPIPPLPPASDAPPLPPEVPPPPVPSSGAAAVAAAAGAGMKFSFGMSSRSRGVSLASRGRGGRAAPPPRGGAPLSKGAFAESSSDEEEA